MSTSIDTVTISSIEDRRIVLANSSIARVLDIGTSWNVIRLGIRCALDDGGASIYGPERFYIGMLSNPSAGVANGPMDNTTSHFVGWQQSYTFGSRIAGPPIVYDFSGGNASVVKKVGSTSTTGAQSFLGRISAQPATIRNGVIVEITKGSPNFTVECLFNQSNSVVDYSKATFISAMEKATITQAEGVLDAFGTWSKSGAVAVAVNEGVNGSLNALCVSWGRTFPALHISDVFWSKIS